MTYIPFRNLASVTRYLDPEGENIPVTISVDHDEWLNALNITEPRGRHVETYELDIQDRPVGITNIEGQTMSITDGLLDFVRSVTRFDGSTITNTFDNAGRPDTVEFRSGAVERTLSFAYTANSLLAGMEDEHGQIGLVYDRLGQVTNQTQTDTGLLAASLDYAYNPVGSPTNTTLTVNDAEALSRAFQTDAVGRLSQLQASEAGSWAFNYNPTNGHADSVAHLDGGAGVQYDYDHMDRMTDIEWQAVGGGALRGFVMEYDTADSITSVVQTDGGRRAYTYDSLDRLTGEQHRTPTDTLLYSASYEYDLAGNRTQSVINGATRTYTLGLGYRLSHCSSDAPSPETTLAYAYDSAGNVTQITDASGIRGLSWDIQYRLTQVAVDGTPVETYGYDPLGRRAWTSDGSVTTWHVYDGMHCIADVAGNGTILRSYTYGPGIDNLLALTDHTTATPTTYFALTDHLGTVHAFADETGTILESYRFDAWGNVLAVYDSAGLEIPNHKSQISNRFLFQGREYSWATGLYNFRARWYDPETGRWLSKDPIGIAGGLNQYVAFGNSPVMFVDPEGLVVVAIFARVKRMIIGTTYYKDEVLTNERLNTITQEVYDRLHSGDHSPKLWFDIPEFFTGYATEQYFLMEKDLPCGRRVVRRIPARELNYIGIGMYNSRYGITPRQGMLEVEFYKFLAFADLDTEGSIEWMLYGMRRYYEIQHNGNLPAPTLGGSSR